MKAARTWAGVGLVVGGVNSCAMGAYHFILPYAWGWGTPLSTLPPAVRWGSYATNFFMSYLMLAGGVLTLLAWRRSRTGRPADPGIVVVMGGFWLVNAVYQVVVPMPLPSGWLPLRLALLGFALVTGGAYGVGLNALRTLSGSRRSPA
jgi:hypothetical protein